MTQITEDEMAEMAGWHSAFDAREHFVLCQDDWPCLTLRLLAACREQATELADVRAKYHELATAGDEMMASGKAAVAALQAEIERLRGAISMALDDRTAKCDEILLSALAYPEVPQ